VLAGEYEIVQAAVERHWNEAARMERESVIFDRARWRVLTIPEQRALLRRAVQHLRPGLRDVDFAPLDAAVRFSRSAQSGRACDVTGGLCLAIDYDWLVLREWTADFVSEADVPQLDDAGVLSSGWEFRAEPVIEWTLDLLENDSSAWRVLVDAAKVGERGLQLRPRRDGDRFQPLGLSGHSVKVSDFMINRKVPAALRDRWPLVVSEASIVWVAGLRLDERFKVIADTQHVMCLEFARPHA
jgi:tRNA(Ile)-lysidine synthase